MTDMRLQPRVAGIASARTADGDTFMAARGMRDGGIVNWDWRAALAFEGRVFRANMGQQSTPLTFTSYVTLRPSAAVRWAAGNNVAIIPLRVRVALDASAGTATIITVRTEGSDIGAATSSAATSGTTSLNLRGDSPYASAGVPLQLYTATGTATAGGQTMQEYDRVDFSAAAAAGSDGRNYLWEPQLPPLIFPNVAGATLAVYVSGTTTQPNGYVTIDYAEVSANFFQ